MAIFDDTAEIQHIVGVGLEDDGILITFGDGLVILFSGKRLRSCAFAHFDQNPDPQDAAAGTKQTAAAR